MAILAMCFDLMQEEIVAKFRWIGTKIGIVEKEEEDINPSDKIPDTKHKRALSSSSSINDANPPMNTHGELGDNDNENDLPTRPSSSASRKASPRNNIARVHPVDSNASNEATLHQRIAPAKSN